MEIKNITLNMSRESVLSFYELKIKHEERSAFITIILIFLGIFLFGPFLMTRIILEGLGQMDISTGMLDIIIIQSLIIVILALCITTNAYRCGKLFKVLRKTHNLEEAIQYIKQLDDENAQFYVAYILMFYNYQYSYITDEDKLVIIYKDSINEMYYTTYMFDRLCDKDCEDATLLVNERGIQIVHEM